MHASLVAGESAAGSVPLPAADSPAPRLAPPRRMRCARCRRLFWIPDTLPVLPSAACSLACAEALARAAGAGCGGMMRTCGKRIWQWYFWNAAPCPYATWQSRLRCWLWWHTHPRWLMDVRTALLAYHAMQDAARHRARDTS